MENFRVGRTQPPLSALWSDPPNDLTHPARTLPQAIPSCSANLNAVLYQASGPGPNPTALLLHGLPGNEQNLDCAQTMRRSGCNVLTIHYRGSWGNPGVFTIANCLSDAAAALEWLHDAANGRKLRIDRQRLVVVGHSVGGFVAAHLAPTTPASSARR
jgi:pimeloyl-ACP methyl ester carboxylesterase